MKVRRVAIALLAVPLLMASSCEQRATKDAPVDVRLQDNQAPYVVNMPHSFMNLAMKCVGATLVIAHTRQGPPVAIENASVCAEGKAEEIGVPRVGQP